MAEPTLTVKRMVYQLPTTVVARDETGMPIAVICPQCGEEAKVEPDGRVACPTGEAMSRFLSDALARLEAANV